MRIAMQIGKKCAHRRQVERQLSARYAAIRASKVISEGKLSACYAAIRASKVISETQLSARYAAIRASKVTSERQLSARYAVITSSKATASAGPGARLYCILQYVARVVRSDHLKGSYLPAMRRLRRPK